MGLFSKKPPCPICGGKINWFLPTKIEGEYICNDCSSKIDIQSELLPSLTMQGFREYLAFYEENLALRSSFVIHEKLDFGFFDTKLIFDMEHRLFCLSGVPDKTVFQGSALKAFRISEDNMPLLEGSANGLIRYVSTVPDRVAAMAPQLHAMAAAQRMAEHAERMRQGNNPPDGRPPEYRPYRDIPEPFKQFYVELQLDHPYWHSFRCDMTAPTFNNDYPDAGQYMMEYQQGVMVMERLAALLMQVAFPGVGEISGTSGAAQTQSASVEHVADDIVKFKTLLDAGIITQEEFDAKKKQLLGI